MSAKRKIVQRDLTSTDGNGSRLREVRYESRVRPSANLAATESTTTNGWQSQTKGCPHLPDGCKTGRNIEGDHRDTDSFIE